jgi:AraC family transcriptional regulator
MEPRFENLAEKAMVGNSVITSFAADKTYTLWNAFMPRRIEITNTSNSNLYSISVYGDGFFKSFDPTREFEKWAAIEVADNALVPDGMKAMIIPAGLYAVFIHIGPASTGPITFNYIFSNWLPNSKYVLDNRPHMDIMGENYRSNDPDAEEEIWVPVRLK